MTYGVQGDCGLAQELAAEQKVHSVQLQHQRVSQVVHNTACTQSEQHT